MDFKEMITRKMGEYFLKAIVEESPKKEYEKYGEKYRVPIAFSIVCYENLKNVIEEMSIDEDYGDEYDFAIILKKVYKYHKEKNVWKTLEYIQKIDKLLERVKKN